jgi:hypothetical protein
MLVLTWMLSLGVRESARVNNVMVLIKMIVVLLFIVVGVNYVKPANWQPFMPFGAGSVMSAAALVFFAFIGFDAVTSAAEEVKNPKRDLPIGIIGSLAICTVLYVIVSAIMTGIVPFMLFKGVDHPVSLALQHAGRKLVRRLRRPRRDPRHDHRDAGDGLRPDPHPVRHVARRPAAGQAVDRAPEIRHPVLRHLDGRHRVRPDRRLRAARTCWPNWSTSAPWPRSAWCRWP